jgi:hypothetical protein
MRMMNVNNGVMVKVLERRDDRLLIVHPANGKQIEVPAYLYVSPPRCIAEREMRRQKEARRKWWEREQMIEARRREEAELKERVRRGEVQAVIYKERVFPIVDGDGLAIRYLDEIRGLSVKEKKGTLKKKIVEEMLRRCKHWTVDEVFDESWRAEMDWAYGEWLANEKAVARWLQ